MLPRPDAHRLAARGILVASSGVVALELGDRHDRNRREREALGRVHLALLEPPAQDLRRIAVLGLEHHRLRQERGLVDERSHARLQQIGG